MRRTRLTAGLLVLAALTAGGCGARAHGSPVTNPTVAPALPPSTEARAAAIPKTETRAPGSTGTTTTTAHAGTALEQSTDDVDQLLAELDTRLAGLDQLLDDTAAAMAAEEGEIIP